MRPDYAAVHTKCVLCTHLPSTIHKLSDLKLELKLENKQTLAERSRGKETVGNLVLEGCARLKTNVTDFKLTVHLECLIALWIHFETKKFAFLHGTSRFLHVGSCDKQRKS